MALDDFLFPGETIRYKCPIPVEMERHDYELYVTDQRLILFKRRGLWFKRDDFVSERVANIHSLDYRERGALFHKATVTVGTGQQSLLIALKGSPEACKMAYQGLQGALGLQQAEPAPRPAPDVAGEIPQAEALEEYAGFWIRLVAALIDGILLSFVSLVLVSIVYFIGLWAWRGQTLGMMAAHVQVVRTDGKAMDLGTAAIRFLGYILCWLTLGIGFLIIAFDARKQGLHDKIANTYVIAAREG